MKKREQAQAERRRKVEAIVGRQTENEDKVEITRKPEAEIGERVKAHLPVVIKQG